MSDTHPSVEEIVLNIRIAESAQRDAFRRGDIKRLDEHLAEFDDAIAAINDLRRADQLALLERLEVLIDHNMHEFGDHYEKYVRVQDLVNQVHGERSRLNGTGKER